MCVLIINTSYQKLPFGSGDYPDTLLFHQALNQVSNSSDGNYPVLFRLCYRMVRNNDVIFVVLGALYSDRLQELLYCSQNVPSCKTFLGYVRAYTRSDFKVVIHRDICSEHSLIGRRNCLMTEAASSLSATAGPELSITRNPIANLASDSATGGLAWVRVCVLCRPDASVRRTQAER